MHAPINYLRYGLRPDHPSTCSQRWRACATPASDNAARARAADGAEPARAEVVAAGVRVLTAGLPASSASTGLLGSSGPGSAPVLLLATTPEQSLAIAAAVVGSRLSVTLRAG